MGETMNCAIVTDRETRLSVFTSVTLKPTLLDYLRKCGGKDDISVTELAPKEASPWQGISTKVRQQLLTVLSGQITVRLRNGEVQLLNKGDQLLIQDTEPSGEEDLFHGHSIEAGPEGASIERWTMQHYFPTERAKAEHYAKPKA